ncbi:MAG TPA: hypothetical protein VNX21_07780, partial [Candidatus Thermoplasmatota archaeon]|nr:hypothetical protein [Candidatus Thermoplasmatota archaeon]
LDVTVATEKASYGMQEAFQDGVRVTVTVKYLDGTPVEGATVTVDWTRSVVLTFSHGTTSGTTDAAGVATIVAPKEATLFGQYSILARAAAPGNSGAVYGAYSVGL